jgi:hypothetical protein
MPHQACRSDAVVGLILIPMPAAGDLQGLDQ